MDLSKSSLHCLSVCTAQAGAQASLFCKKTLFGGQLRPNAPKSVNATFRLSTCQRPSSIILVFCTRRNVTATVRSPQRH